MMENDMYGRTITKTTSGELDIYTVMDVYGGLFSVSYPKDTPIYIAYSTINAMQPSWYVADE